MMRHALMWLVLPALSCHAGTIGKAVLPANAGDLLDDPAAHWTLDVETAALWRCSSNTFQNYVLLPQIIAVRTPAHFRMDFGETELTLRAGLRLIVEPIARGPEDAYFAFSFSPSFEWWNARKTDCLYLDVGGGMGWIDSTDVPGGQGQDRTLNWFAAAGWRHMLWSGRGDFHAGVMFQHLSNGGATDPNPGIDAVGPVIGFSFRF